MLTVSSLFHYSSMERQLATELLAIGIRTSKPYLSLIVAGVIAVESARHVPGGVLWAWLAAISVTTLFGLWLGWRYWNCGDREMTRAELRTAEWLGIAYASMVGASWGGSSQLMVPGEHTHNILVMTVYLGVGAGASTISIFSPARLLISTLLLMMIFILPLPRLFPDGWHWLAALIFLYALVILRSAWERRRMMVDNLRLRNEKQGLLEAQMLETAKAVKANQEKSAFLAAASHDLRQPLHALMLTGHALSLRTPPGELRDLVQSILDAGTALSNQFNHLMDLSRLESGTYQVNRSLQPVAELMQQVMDAHQQPAHSRGLDLRCRISRALRDKALHVDTGLLSRVMNNLLHSAEYARPRA